MLRLALIFFVIAVLAACLNLTLIAAVAYTAAKVLFLVFLVMAVLALIGGVVQRPPI